MAEVVVRRDSSGDTLATTRGAAAMPIMTTEQVVDVLFPGNLPIYDSEGDKATLAL